MSWYYGGGALPPEFVSATRSDTSGSGNTELTIATTSIPAGYRVVIAAVGNSGAKISSITDSRGNSYAPMTSAGADGTATQGVSIFSAHVATELQIGDKITIVWNTATFQNKAVWLCRLRNCAVSGQPNVTKARSVYATSVSEAATTTEANTVTIGLLSVGGASDTYSGGSWTSVNNSGASGRMTYLISATFSTAGSKNPSGTWATGGGQANCWAAFD